MILNLDVTDREIQALFNIIDASVKQNGIRGAGDAVAWTMKLETAMKETDVKSG
jgi:hypothetical protein